MARVTRQRIARRRLGIKKITERNRKFQKRSVLALVRAPRVPRSARVPRGLNPFPQTKIARHKYVDNIVMPAAGGAGQLSVYQFRTNSLQDPDLTGVGHQPMFRDEMAQKYSYYTVIQSYIKVTWDPADIEFMNRGIYVTEDASHPIDPSTFGEIFNLRTPQIPSQQNQAQVSRASFNAGKYYKTTQKAIMADEDKRTSAANNPAFSPLYNLIRAPVDATQTIGTSRCQVEIIFIAAWRELSSYTQS